MYFGNKGRILSTRRQEHRDRVTDRDNHVRELVVAFYDVVRGFGIAVEEKDAGKSGGEQKKNGLGTFFHATENEGEHVPEPGEKVEGTRAESGRGRVLLDWRGGSVPLEKAAEKRKELLAARAAPGAQGGAELQRAVDDLTQQVRDLQAKEESNERKLREHDAQLLQRTTRNRRRRPLRSKGSGSRRRRAPSPRATRRTEDFRPSYRPHRPACSTCRRWRTSGSSSTSTRAARRPAPTRTWCWRTRTRRTGRPPSERGRGKA
mmetsp:Transcript_26913/g.67789  ORF Transcript_26913/g.67789 Transcript_26913/m.67789 type:complete len:262 (+) Transcript_26913:2045-2830(+)